MFLLLFVAVTATAGAQQNSRRIDFDDDWLFAKDSIIQADAPVFDDSKWRKVSLPHDWSIEDLPNQISGSITGPFDKASINSIATGFTVGGTGWYRKKFVTSAAAAGKSVSICFDGVYMNSDVWLNGHHLGNHPYGYSPFNYDITSYLLPAGQQNVIAVRVQNNGKNSRWYSGSGIYRHVWLTVTGPVHINPWGVYITTPAVSANGATVHIQTSVQNENAARHNISIATTIFSPAGKPVGSSQQNLLIPANTLQKDMQAVTISNPSLWSVQTPQLYKAITEIKADGNTLDRVETVFGIRTITIDATNGLLLNGKKTKLNGGCIHHDNGPLGAAAIDRAEERKIEILKKNGFNAIRLSHNPPSPSTALLDACDRLGMLVIDEAFDMWERPKNSQDYHLYFKDWWQRDISAMIYRDRNHPSVIMWSIGNEVNERADSSGLRIERSLSAEVRSLDSTRPVTEAICTFWEHPGYKWDTTAAAFAMLDVGGYNYMLQMYESDHQKFPLRMIMGTESFPLQALENYTLAENHPYVLGDFVWTAVDYLGEASIGNSKIVNKKGFQASQGWPWFNAYCGDIDLIGNKKPQSYYRDVVWRNSPIAMAVHTPIPAGMTENISMWGWPDEQQSWTWPGAEGKTLQVRIFSRAPLVRLFLNNQLIGEQKIAAGNITAVFDVPYQPGVLKAVNIENEKATDSIEFTTTGAPAHIKLTADRTAIKTGNSDLSYIMVEVTDDKGRLVPDAEIPVTFSISGAGEIAGAGNGNPVDMESFQQPRHKTWRGRCLVIVRPKGGSGTITLKVAANGLTPAKMVITTNP